MAIGANFIKHFNTKWKIVYQKMKKYSKCVSLQSSGVNPNFWAWLQYKISVWIRKTTLYFTDLLDSAHYESEIFLWTNIPEWEKQTSGCWNDYFDLALFLTLNSLICPTLLRVASYRLLRPLLSAVWANSAKVCLIMHSTKENSIFGGCEETRWSNFFVCAKKYKLAYSKVKK